MVRSAAHTALYSSKTSPAFVPLLSGAEKNPQKTCYVDEWEKFHLQSYERGGVSVLPAGCGTMKSKS